MDVLTNEESKSYTGGIGLGGIAIGGAILGFVLGVFNALFNDTCQK